MCALHSAQTLSPRDETARILPGTTEKPDAVPPAGAGVNELPQAVRTSEFPPMTWKRMTVLLLHPCREVRGPI